MIKQFIKDGIVAFVYYTIVLTPYTIFVMNVTFDQYVAWLAMQCTIVPPAGVGFAWIIRRIGTSKSRNNENQNTTNS